MTQKRNHNYTLITTNIQNFSFKKYGMFYIYIYTISIINAI